MADSHIRRPVGAFLNLLGLLNLLRAAGKTEAPQGLGTVERPGGPNGEVPRPLRPFVFLALFSPDFGAARSAAPAGEEDIDEGGLDLRADGPYVAVDVALPKAEDAPPLGT